MPQDLLSHIPNYPGLLEPGNIDIYHRPQVANEDGSISTILSMTAGVDGGKVVLLPTIVNGQKLSPKDAFEYYRHTGENLGVFGSQDAADAYDKQMHEQLGWIGTNNNWPKSPNERFYDFRGMFNND